MRWTLILSAHLSSRRGLRRIVWRRFPRCPHGLEAFLARYPCAGKLRDVQLLIEVAYFLRHGFLPHQMHERIISKVGGRGEQDGLRYLAWLLDYNTGGPVYRTLGYNELLLLSPTILWNLAYYIDSTLRGFTSPSIQSEIIREK